MVGGSSSTGEAAGIRLVVGALALARTRGALDSMTNASMAAARVSTGAILWP